MRDIGLDRGQGHGKPGTYCGCRSKAPSGSRSQGFTPPRSVTNTPPALRRAASQVASSNDETGTEYSR